MMEENTALINADYVQYATPNKAAFNLLPEEIQNNTNIYPTDEYIDRSHLVVNIGHYVLKLDEIWQELRNK